MLKAFFTSILMFQFCFFSYPEISFANDADSGEENRRVVPRRPSLPNLAERNLPPGATPPVNRPSPFNWDVLLETLYNQSDFKQALMNIQFNMFPAPNLLAAVELIELPSEGYEEWLASKIVELKSIIEAVIKKGQGPTVPGRSGGSSVRPQVPVPGQPTVTPEMMKMRDLMTDIVLMSLRFDLDEQLELEKKIIAAGGDANEVQRIKDEALAQVEEDKKKTVEQLPEYIENQMLLEKLEGWKWLNGPSSGMANRFQGVAFSPKNILKGSAITGAAMAGFVAMFQAIFLALYYGEGTDISFSSEVQSFFFYMATAIPATLIIAATVLASSLIILTTLRLGAATKDGLSLASAKLTQKTLKVGFQVDDLMLGHTQLGMIALVTALEEVTKGKTVPVTLASFVDKVKETKVPMSSKRGCDLTEMLITPLGSK